MADRRAVREVFVGSDGSRQFFEVTQSDAGDLADDEHAAIVLLDGNTIQCYRCDRKADVEFKCIHIHSVRRTLDL